MTTAVYFHGVGRGVTGECEPGSADTDKPILAGGLDKVFNLGPLGLQGDDLGILLLCLLCNHFMGQMKQDTPPASAKSPVHPPSYNLRQLGLGWRGGSAGEVFTMQAN